MTMDGEEVNHQDIIKESPAKRRKTVQEASTPTQSGYNSQVDSGDELFNGYETVATMPVNKPESSQPGLTQVPSSPPIHVTQPTQVLGQTLARPDMSSPKPSIVQVAASSPLRPPAAQRAPSAAKPSPAGGVLASGMAPAGTAYRPPLGIQKAPVKPPIIDLSDDDGPTYRGHTSDEELSVVTRADIKPSKFAKSSANTGNQSSGRTGNRFSEIMTNSFYKPITNGVTNQSSRSATATNNGPQGRGGSSASHPTGPRSLKRPADSANTAAAQSRAVKQKTQMGPERAKHVADIPLESIPDFQLREKISRIRVILPDTTVLECRNALLTKRFNFEDALEFLTSENGREQEANVVISDDELAPTTPSLPVKPTAKREVKAPNRTIQDKWSSTQALPKVLPPVKAAAVTSPPGARARPGHDTKLPPSSPDFGAPRPPAARARSPEYLDDSDSAVASASGDQDALEGKVLNFFNTCSAKDLADISNNNEETAMVILSQKPFNSLEEIRRISSEVPSVTKTGKKRTTKRPIGDKIVETCLDMWTGYEAVDELVTRCEALGAPVADEMKNWGFDVFGAAKTGELEMVSFDGHANRSVRDSGIGTPTSSPLTPKDDQHVEDAKNGSRSDSTKPNSGQFIGQPAIMSPDVTLKDYQLVGLNWLALLFKKDLSCILADEMGLGKTCQVIAFLGHLFEIGEKGPHLVVVPGSTLENWLREFRRFCPSLVVEPYYGLEKDRGEQRARIEDSIESINVIVTTYDLASKKIDSKFLRHLRPTVCVYDEGHALKNSTSKRYEALMRIPASFRLLLTGTPLQNNLKELAALLGFILPSVFRERRGDLDFIFKAKARTTDDSHAALLSAQRIARAKSMMTPFVLRRKKHQVLKHLPAKTSRTEYCEMTPAQWQVYNDHLQQAKDAMLARAAGKKPTKEAGNVLMQLRKAAIHPMLFRRIFDDAKIKKMARECIKEADLTESDPDLVLEDMSYLSDFQLYTFCKEHPTTMAPFNVQKDEWMDSGKVIKLTELLVKFREQGDRVLVFSQFTMVLDILEAVLETLQMQFFRFDGSTKIEERQDMIDQFYEEKEVTVFLLSTKAGGMGINLACANKVVIFDQSFNPQEDIQAENRAHRVGQQRQVEVIRLVSRGTVEEQIHALGETKLTLDDRVAGDDPAAAAAAVAADPDDKDVEAEGLKAVERMWVETQGIVGG